MTALVADRNTARIPCKDFHNDMAAGVKIFAGSIVFLDSSGNAVPATASTGKICAGCAQEQVDNTTGAAGALKIKVRAGEGFKFANGESITKANIGDMAYALDDQTVGLTASGKSPVGPIVSVDDDDGGVFVKIEPAFTTTVTGLTAANNLSDVSSASTARSNLGLEDDSTVLFTRQPVVAGGAAYTVGSAPDGDSLIQSATDNHVTTLPKAAAGNKGKRVTLQNTAANAGALVTLQPNASDAVQGTVGTVSSGGVNGKGWNNTKATAKKGDYTTLESDGSATWWIVGGVGTWASTP